MILRRTCLKKKIGLKCKDTIWEKMMGNLCVTCHEKKKKKISDENEKGARQKFFADEKLKDISVYESADEASPGARRVLVAGMF
ncbi:hypothetical protein B7463_g757, partial [Scytalidium lignicola]